MSHNLFVINHLNVNRTPDYRLILGNLSSAAIAAAAAAATGSASRTRSCVRDRRQHVAPSYDKAGGFEFVDRILANTSTCDALVLLRGSHGTLQQRGQALGLAEPRGADELHQRIRECASLHLFLNFISAQSL